MGVRDGQLRVPRLCRALPIVECFNRSPDTLATAAANGPADFGFGYSWSLLKPYAAGNLQGVNYDGYVDYFDVS